MRKTLLRSMVSLVLVGVLIACNQTFLFKSTVFLVLVSALTGCIQGYADPACSYPAYLPHPRQLERLVLVLRSQAASIYHQPIGLWDRLIASHKGVWAESRGSKFKSGLVG